MGKHRKGAGDDFWRAGAPVRPVRAIRGKEGGEQNTKDVKKTEVKSKKRVKFSDGDSRREYAEAVAKERQEEDEGIQRESPIAGGSSGSSDEPEVIEQKEGDHDEELDERYYGNGLGNNYNCLGQVNSIFGF